MVSHQQALKALVTRAPDGEKRLQHLVCLALRILGHRSRLKIDHRAFGTNTNRSSGKLITGRMRGCRRLRRGWRWCR
jgi:hypothetical protein